MGENPLFLRPAHLLLIINSAAAIIAAQLHEAVEESR
jgi:hypothetical protein